MSDAGVIFLPWLRQGLAARIATPDPLTTPLPAQAPLGVTLGVVVEEKHQNSRGPCTAG